MIAIIPPGSQFNTQEQNAYTFVKVPIRQGSVQYSNFAFSKWAKNIDGPYLASGTLGGYIKFKFRGRRIGIEFTRQIGYGVLGFEIDGIVYDSLDTSSTDTLTYNVKYIIATDLFDEEHILTITKMDANSTTVSAFLQDDAAAAPTFVQAMTNYHVDLDEARAVPTTIGITDTALPVSGFDLWAYSFMFTNTTAAVINVTLKNNAGTVIAGPFPIPANDVRPIPGPLYFAGGAKVIASATGCFVTMGGQ